MELRNSQEIITSESFPQSEELTDTEVSYLPNINSAQGVRCTLEDSGEKEKSDALVITNSDAQENDAKITTSFGRLSQSFKKLSVEDSKASLQDNQQQDYFVSERNINFQQSLLSNDDDIKTNTNFKVFQSFQSTKVAFEKDYDSKNLQETQEAIKRPQKPRNLEKSATQKQLLPKIPKIPSHSHFDLKSELLDHRLFKEDNDDQISTEQKNLHSQEISEIKSIDIIVLKQRCLGMGKRLTWHLEHIQNQRFQPNTILEKEENISLPVNIQIRNQDSVGRLLGDNLPFMYSQNTVPTFYFNEYKVAVVLDLSAISNLKIDANYQLSQMQYFMKVRQSLSIILQNLFFQIKNEVLNEIKKQSLQTRSKFLPRAAKSIEQRKFLQYQFQLAGPGGMNNQNSRMTQNGSHGQLSSSLAPQTAQQMQKYTGTQFPRNELLRQVQSDDDSMVSDSINNFWYRNNTNFPIEEQSESVLDSMYESNYPGYDSTKQSPLKKSLVITKKMQTQTSQTKVNVNSSSSNLIPKNMQKSSSVGLNQAIKRTVGGQYQPWQQQNQGQPSSGANIQNNQYEEAQLQKAQPTSKGQQGSTGQNLMHDKFFTLGDKVTNEYLKEHYEPKVYLSLIVKGLKGSRSSPYKTVFLDKQLQYENIEELAKSIDQQLTLIEDEIIDQIIHHKSSSKPGATHDSDEQRLLSNEMRSCQSPDTSMIEHGAKILDLMKKDIQPMLILIGDVANLSLTTLGRECSSSNLTYTKGKKITDSLQRLSYKDTKIVVVDINNSQKHTQQNSPYMFNQFRSIKQTCLPGKNPGMIEFLNDFKFICFMTQGNYYNFDQLVSIDQKCKEEAQEALKNQGSLNKDKKDIENQDGVLKTDSNNELLGENQQRKGLKFSQSLNEISGLAYNSDNPQKMSGVASSELLETASIQLECQPKQVNLLVDSNRWKWNPFQIKSTARQIAQKHQRNRQNQELNKLQPDLPTQGAKASKIVSRKVGSASTYRLPVMNSFQRILFSRQLQQRQYQPEELDYIYQYITKNYQSQKVLEQLKHNKGCHPDQIKTISLKKLFLENELVPRYAKLRIQTNILQNINFSRICEFRSKCMFKFHSINSVSKSNNVSKRLYGVRIKYLFWLNADVVLACHMKKIKEDSSEIDALHGIRGQKQQDPNATYQNPETSKVEVVFKLVAQVHTVQKFVRDFSSQSSKQQEDLSEKQEFSQNVAAPKSRTNAATKFWIGQKYGTGNEKDSIKWDLCKEVTDMIQQVHNSDRRFIAFSNITNQIRKIFKFIHSRQRRMGAKFQNSLKHKKQVAEQNLLKQSEKTDNIEVEGDKADNKRQALNKPNYFGVAHNLKELDKQHPFAEDDPIIFGQSIQAKPTAHEGQRSRRKKHTKHVKFGSHARQDLNTNEANLNIEEHLENVEYSMWLTQEQAIQVMQDNKEYWDALRECSHQFESEDDWSKHFSYRRQDYIAPSNYTSIAQINQLQQIYLNNYLSSRDAKSAAKNQNHGIQTQFGAMRDSSILLKTFLALRRLTSFSLDGQTFVQVFKDKKNKNHHDIFGFCLVKLDWHAYNVLSVHLGFYQVCERSKNQFGKAVKKLLLDINLHIDSQIMANQHQNHINFKLFQKNVIDRIFKACQEKKGNAHQNQQKSLDISQFLEDISKANQYDELSKEFCDSKTFNVEMIPYFKQHSVRTNHGQCHHKLEDKAQIDEMSFADWKFISDNLKTSQEVYVAIFQQRLDEGFIFLSSFNKMKFNTVQFVKILEGRKTKFQNINTMDGAFSARKDSFHSISSAKVGLIDARRSFRRKGATQLFNVQHQLQRRLSISQNRLRDEQQAIRNKKFEEEQTQDIVVQYIIKFDQHFQKQHKGKYCLRTLLVMEKESCFFLFKKQQTQDNKKIKSSFPQEMLDGSFTDRRPSIHSNLSHRSSHIDEENSTLQKGPVYESMSEVHFFKYLSDYINQADQHLKKMICTFHNIIKNSLLQSINQEVILQQQQHEYGGSYDVTHQLCYFKNINIRNKRQMKRQNLEQSINQRIDLLREDRVQFLTNQYPELANDSSTRPLHIPGEVKTPQLSKNQRGDKSKAQSKQKHSQKVAHMIRKDAQIFDQHDGNEDEEQDAFDQDLMNIGIIPFAKSNPQEHVVENNIFEFDGILENANPIRVEELQVPNLERTQNEQVQIKDHNFGKKFLDFYQKLRDIFDDFSDFKKQNNQFYCFDLYFKLIAKQIIFIIKVPSQSHFEKLMIKKTQTTIRVEFFVIKKKMIQLSQRLKNNRYFRFLTANLDSNMRGDTNDLPQEKVLGPGNKFISILKDKLQATSSLSPEKPKEKVSEGMSYGDQIPQTNKESHSHNQSHSMDQSVLSGAADGEIDPQIQCSSEDAQQKSRVFKDKSSPTPSKITKVEEYDEQINQIDQIEDYLIYQNFDQSTPRIQFENRVSNIVDNFLLFIQQSYNKLFSETVLMNLNISNSSDSCSNDQSYLTKRDFYQTLQSMSENRFTIDISFLGLLVRSIQKNLQNQKDEELVARQEEQSKIFVKEINEVFKMIQTRNFRECQIDPNYFIFSYNKDDEQIDLQANTEFDLYPIQQDNFFLDEEKLFKKTEDMNSYMKNLQGGSDAFQENELQQLLIHDKKVNKTQRSFQTDNQDSRGAQEFKDQKRLETNLQYHTCKKLILNVELVVKNYKGEIVIQEPLRDITQIFSKTSANYGKISQVAEELQTKIKHILVQRGCLKEEEEGKAIHVHSDEQFFSSNQNKFNIGSFESTKYQNKNKEMQDQGLLRLFQINYDKNLNVKNQKNQASSFKGEHQSEKEFSKLSEDEKLERYKKIYYMFQQFINDENPSQSLDQLQILNYNNKSQQVYEKDMWQSSMEIQFCFHSVPHHIGLIKDRYIDLLCFNKENILVNDDDHEDLIRVCNLFNLFNLSKSDIMQTQRTDYLFHNKKVQFSELQEHFNNKQITRSIPFFFKNSYTQNDYRIYKYDDIQRKLIYGLLRRSYALLAEAILLNLQRHTSYDVLAVSMMKKYLGQLLNSQKICLTFPVLHNQNFKPELVHSFLLTEIKSEYIMKFGQLDNQFELERQNDILNQNENTFKTNQRIEYQQIFCLQAIIDQKENEDKISVEDAIMFLKITQNQAKNCFIEMIYYTKCLQKSQSRDLRWKLWRLLQKIEERIKIKLILLEIDEKKEMSANINLVEPQMIIIPNVLNKDKQKGSNDSRIISQAEWNQVSQYIQSRQNSATDDGRNAPFQSFQTSNQSEHLNNLSKNSSGNFDSNAHLQQRNESQKDGGQQANRVNKQNSKQSNRSKLIFMKNMQKYNVDIKPQQSVQETNNQRNAQKSKLIDAKNQSKAAKKPVAQKFELQKYYEHWFPLTSYLDVESAIQVISQNLVITPNSIYDCEDMFIVNDWALKDTKSSQKTPRSRKSTKPDGFNNAKRYILRIPKVINIQNMSISDQKRISEMLNNQPDDQASQNKICIEVYGIESLKDKNLFNNLFQDLNAKLLSATIDKFSEKFVPNHRSAPNTKLMNNKQVIELESPIEVPFILNQQDLQYLQESDKSLYIVFPLKSALGDRFSFMQAFIANLQRFMIPAIYSENKGQKQWKYSFVGSRREPPPRSGSQDYKMQPRPNQSMAQSKNRVLGASRTSSANLHFDELRNEPLDTESSQQMKEDHEELCKMTSIRKRKFPTRLQSANVFSATGLGDIRSFTEHDLLDINEETETEIAKDKSQVKSGNSYTSDSHQMSPLQQTLEKTLQGSSVFNQNELTVVFNSRDTMHLFNHKIDYQSLINSLADFHQNIKNLAPSEQQSSSKQLIENSQNYKNGELNLKEIFGHSNVLLQMEYLQRSSDDHESESIYKILGKQPVEHLQVDPNFVGLQAFNDDTVNEMDMFVVSPQIYEIHHPNKPNQQIIKKNEIIKRVQQRVVIDMEGSQWDDLDKPLTFQEQSNSDERDTVDFALKLDFQGQLNEKVFCSQLTYLVNITISQVYIETLLISIKKLFRQHSISNEQLFRGYERNIRSIQKQIRLQKSSQAIFKNYKVNINQSDQIMYLLKILAILLSHFDAKFQNKASFILKVNIQSFTTRQNIKKILIKIPFLASEIKQILKKVKNIVLQENWLNQNHVAEFEVIFCSFNLSFAMRKNGSTSTQFIDLSNDEHEEQSKDGQDIESLKAYPTLQRQVQLLVTDQDESASKPSDLKVVREALLVVHITSLCIDFCSHNFKTSIISQIVSRVEKAIQQDREETNRNHLEHVHRKALTFGHACVEVQSNLKNNLWTNANLKQFASENYAQENQKDFERIICKEASIAQRIEQLKKRNQFEMDDGLVQIEKNLQLQNQTKAIEEQWRLKEYNLEFQKSKQDQNQQNESVGRQKMQTASHQHQISTEEVFDENTSILANSQLKEATLIENVMNDNQGIIICDGFNKLGSPKNPGVAEEYERTIVMHNPEKSYLYKILKNNAHLKIMNDCEYNQQMVQLIDQINVVQQNIVNAKSWRQNQDKIEQSDDESSSSPKIQADEQMNSTNNQSLLQYGYVYPILAQASWLQDQQTSHVRNSIEKSFFLTTLVHPSVRRSIRYNESTSGKHSEKPIKMNPQEKQFIHRLRRSSQPKRTSAETREQISMLLSCSNLMYSQSHQFLIHSNYGDDSQPKNSNHFVDEYLTFIRESIFNHNELKDSGELAVQNTSRRNNKSRSRVLTSMDDFNPSWRESQTKSLRIQLQNQHWDQFQQIYYKYQEKLKLSQSQITRTIIRKPEIPLIEGTADHRDWATGQAKVSLSSDISRGGIRMQQNLPKTTSQRSQRLKSGSRQMSGVRLGEQFDHNNKLNPIQNFLKPIQDKPIFSPRSTQMKLKNGMSHQVNTERILPSCSKTNAKSKKYYFMKILDMNSLVLCEIEVDQFLSNDLSNEVTQMQVNIYSNCQLSKLVDAMFTNQFDMGMIVANTCRYNQSNQQSEIISSIDVTNRIIQSQQEFEIRLYDYYINQVYLNAENGAKQFANIQQILLRVHSFFGQTNLSNLVENYKFANAQNHIETFSLNIELEDLEIPDLEKFLILLQQTLSSEQFDYKQGNKLMSQKQTHNQPMKGSFVASNNLKNFVNFDDIKCFYRRMQRDMINLANEAPIKNIGLSEPSDKNDKKYSLASSKLKSKKGKPKGQKDSNEKKQQPSSLFVESLQYERLLYFIPSLRVEADRLMAQSPTFTPISNGIKVPNLSQDIQKSSNCTSTKFSIDVFALYENKKRAKNISQLRSLIDLDQKFILSNLQDAFNITKDVYLKQKLWTKFFLHQSAQESEFEENLPKKKLLSYVEISDMLGLSERRDLEELDNKYRKLLQNNKFDQKAYAHLVSRFQSQQQKNQHKCFIMQEQKGDPCFIKEMIVFNPEKQNVLLNVRYHIKQERIQIELIYRDSLKQDITHEQDQTERQLVSQVVNVLVNYIWKHEANDK